MLSMENRENFWVSIVSFLCFVSRVYKMLDAGKKIMNFDSCDKFNLCFKKIILKILVV